MNGLSRYLSELYRWNEKINLTAVKREDAEEALIKPSLAMLEFFPAGKGREIFDVGSGGGIPALALAASLPDDRFTLMESDRKKSVFLAHVVGLMKLKNARVVCERAEKLAAMDGYAHCADFVTSRAVKRDDVLNAARGLLKPGGRVIVHRSPKDSPEAVGFTLLAKNDYADCFELK